ALPRWSGVDREEDVDAVLRRVVHRPVVERPRVGRVVGILRVRRAALRDTVRAAPVEVLANLLDVELPEQRERLRDGPVKRLGLVVDADEEELRGVRGLCDGSRRERRDYGDENSDPP